MAASRSCSAGEGREEGGKTRLTVHADAVGLSPLAPQMLAGMEAGWTQSLEKLAELARVIA
jgi:uncharacterized protein YndB with AHSA1/START domain